MNAWWEGGRIGRYASEELNRTIIERAHNKERKVETYTENVGKMVRICFVGGSKIVGMRGG